MMNTRCTKLSMVRDDSKSSKTSNKKCPNGDLMTDVNTFSGYVGVEHDEAKQLGRTRK